MPEAATVALAGYGCKRSASVPSPQGLGRQREKKERGVIVGKDEGHEEREAASRLLDRSSSRINSCC